jgi:nucleoid DNA-binding protein
MLVDVLSDFIQNWLEDNINPSLFENMETTVGSLQTINDFERKVNSRNYTPSNDAQLPYVEDAMFEGSHVYGYLDNQGKSLEFEEFLKEKPRKGKEITDLFIETIKDIITSGESLEIAGFGTFKTVDLAPRTSRNPRTGEAIKVPSRKRIKFKTSIQLEVKENA